MDFYIGERWIKDVEDETQRHCIPHKANPKVVKGILNWLHRQKPVSLGVDISSWEPKSIQIFAIGGGLPDMGCNDLLLRKRLIGHHADQVVVVVRIFALVESN